VFAWRRKEAAPAKTRTHWTQHLHHGLTRPFSTSDLTARSIATWTRAGRRCDALSLRTCSWRTENLGFARARQNTDRSQLGTASKMCITDFIHSSEASTPDNGNKGEVPIHFSIDENDNVVYVMHERRRYVDGWSVILERFVASDAWVAIQALLWSNTNFKANNAKVKGHKTSLVPNRKLLQKCACRCTKGPGQPDETSCRICSELIANLHKYYHDRNQWYKAAEECKARILTNGRVIVAVNPCDQCGGECHQGMGMPNQTWPSSQQLMYDLLLCDPNHTHA
jgi:hypothetical protein